MSSLLRALGTSLRNGRVVRNQPNAVMCFSERYAKPLRRERALTIYDPRKPETNANPFPVFEELRRTDPVSRNERVGGWVVTRYTDVQASLRDPRLSSDRISNAMSALEPDQREQMSELARALTTWTVFSDPPRHTRLRNLFIKAFTPKAMDRLRLRIETLVDELWTKALANGRIDFIADFAYPLPALVICDMIGIPHDDLDQIHRWSDDVATFIGLPKKPWDTFVAAESSNRAMTDYFRVLVREHRERPRPDMLSALLEASDVGQSLTEDEVIATCILLLFAAHTTTTHLLGNGLVALLRNPEQLEILRARPESIDTAVEELLRYDGPIQAVRRTATAPLTVGTTRVETGELVFLMINAANRDPEKFSEPERLDIMRAENKHLGFGAGIHFCSGAALARMEARLALQAIVSRSSSIEIDHQGEFDWLQSFGFRGIRKLSVRVR